MAGWERWLQGCLWRQMCVSFTQIFFSELLLQSITGRKSQQWYDQHGSTVVLCTVLTGWVSNHSWDCIYCREGLFDNSMMCEAVPRQRLKFLPLGSTFSFSCNGQILPAQAAQESPCMWREKSKAVRWKDLFPQGADCCGAPTIAGHWVLWLLQRDNATFKEIYGLDLITEPQKPGKAGQLEPTSF